MIQAKTYTVGDTGGVRRLDNLAGTWTDVSVTNTFPAAAGISLFDVETDPLDGAKVFAIGEGNTLLNLFGIYVSTDAGATWFIPGGNYQTNVTLGTTLIRWNEVYVIDSNNIVVAGDNGYVAKSTDGGLTFNLCTQLPSLVCTICTDLPRCWSLHFLTPNYGVVGTEAHVALTIDGGLTWSILYGGLPISDGLSEARNIVGIHIDATQQVIVACAQNKIYYSTNGGVSWISTYFWSARNGQHLTWINDNELWAFGGGGERVKSTDGGATWIVIQAYNRLGPSQRAGHFYFGQNGFWSQNAGIYSTVNGSSTGTLSETSPYDVFAVWTHYVERTCYLLTSCSGTVAPILVDNDLQASVGQIIRVCPDDLPPAGGSGIGSGTPIPVNPSDPCNTLFELVDCCGVQPISTVSNNLLAYLGGVIVVPSIGFNTCWRVQKAIGAATQSLGCLNLSGAVFYGDCTSCHEVYPCEPVPLLTECECFTISEAAGCDGVITLENIGPIFPTCEDCATVCYLLVDCTDVSNFISSNDQSLSQYVGQVVHLQDCPDKCWQVLVAGDCDNSVCTSPVIESFPDCQSCLPPPPPPPPLELHPRRIKPGYYTPGCPPAYTEKVNCSFGEQMYNQMLVDRYGLTICCEEDRIKWSIKKELLDLKAIYDPELCKCTLNQCCPPVCVDATIQVFNPRPCPAPSNVLADIEVILPPCVPPSGINFTHISIT